MPTQIDEGLQFLKEVRYETRKVTWPSFEESRGTTIVVIVVTIITAVFLFGVDFALSRLIDALMG
ncbi:MAG: preprotein translocase subunit SecE [Deltaproteobacteria bacterium]|nr:preprotein translocase subunit SecE [Deltaproteobacteria bacterium]